MQWNNQQRQLTSALIFLLTKMQREKSMSPSSSCFQLKARILLSVGGLVAPRSTNRSLHIHKIANPWSYQTKQEFHRWAHHLSAEASISRTEDWQWAPSYSHWPLFQLQVLSCGDLPACTGRHKGSSQVSRVFTSSWHFRFTKVTATTPNNRILQGSDPKWIFVVDELHKICWLPLFLEKGDRVRDGNMNCASGSPFWFSKVASSGFKILSPSSMMWREYSAHLIPVFQEESEFFWCFGELRTPFIGG